MAAREPAAYGVLMTASSGDLGQRVSRVENDVMAIYEMLGDISTVQGHHGVLLEAMQGKLDAHDARFDAIDARFDTIDASLTEVLRRLPEG